MNKIFLAVIIFFITVNSLAFLIVILDKIQSRKNEAMRISEGMLFFMATFFGSFGVFAGMLATRHKTNKLHFILGIPMLILENCALLYLIYVYLS